MGIQLILCLNKQGVVRLVRWYEQLDLSKDTQVYISTIYQLISSRDHKNQSNFIESFTDNTKLVYKRYAGLYFVMAVDLYDEESIYLSNIHLFVEVLDAFFGNVCELDIVFNFYKAYMVMDEMFIGGELQEMSKNILLERLNTLDMLE